MAVAVAVGNRAILACLWACAVTIVVSVLRMPTSPIAFMDGMELSPVIRDMAMVNNNTSTAARAINAQFPIGSASNQSSFSFLISKLPSHYHSKLRPSIQASIQPLWTCNGGSSNFEKLLFVHVFKTAGSTMRSFFHNYAKNCRNRSYATLTKCTQVDSKRVVSSTWSPCILADATTKGRHRLLNQQPVRKADLQYDILGGHFRLGLLDYLSTRRKNIKPNPKFRNIVFFRNAAIKYISGKVYVKSQRKKTFTTAEIIQSIQDEMKHSKRSKKFHSKYSTYLLTPEQQQLSGNWTSSQQVQVMVQNLIDYNVTIGIVEDMEGSMEILQHLLDPQSESASLFVQYHESNSSSRNVSPLSSHAILEQLQREDFDTYQQLLNYVKWEQEVTDFAVALQQLQYQAMKQEVEKEAKTGDQSPATKVASELQT